MMKEAYALTGISYEEMADLERHLTKTFELVCTDHVMTASKLRKGELVFITNLSKQDVKRGVSGLLGRVKNVKIDYWRTVPREFDEKEVLTTRIQVEFVDEVRVKKAKDLGKGKGMRVEYERHVLLG